MLLSRRSISLLALLPMVGAVLFSWRVWAGDVESAALPLEEKRLVQVGVDHQAGWSLPQLQAGHTYAVSASLRSGTLDKADRVRIAFQGPSDATIEKILHAGDPDLYTHYRPAKTGKGALHIVPLHVIGQGTPVEVVVRELPIDSAEATAFDPGPNNLETAAPLVLGRSVYGAADEVD